MRPHLPLRIVWQPFQLNPELPPRGVERQPGGGRHAADADRYAASERALTLSAAKEGIALAFDRIRRIPSTMAAHRLMRFAARWRKDDILADGLYAAYFEHGRDIGAMETLVACAAAASLPVDAARAFLAGDEEAAGVAAMNGLAHQGGITGVPYFVFNRRFALAGAQEPATFLPLFDALSAAEDDPLSSWASRSRSAGPVKIPSIGV
jgi:predicted DsbA family dithiol-disulfide isomerase